MKKDKRNQIVLISTYSLSQPLIRIRSSSNIDNRAGQMHIYCQPKRTVGTILHPLQLHGNLFKIFVQVETRKSRSFKQYLNALHSDDEAGHETLNKSIHYESCIKALI
jgi:hypothetical protein